MLERPGTVITRDELRQQLWPNGTYVDFDGSLNAALKKLRAALDDDSERPHFIETVAKRGYRFIAPVQSLGSDPAPPQRENPPFRGDTQPSKVRADAVLLPESKPSKLSGRTHVERPWVWAAWIGAGVILAAALFIREVKTSRKPSGVPDNGLRSVAVLPFVNDGAGPDFDYLRFAIPDDIVTDLTYVRSVSVRPEASTAKYATAQVDPQTAGREMRVTHVVAGEFLREKDTLRVTLELTEVASHKVLWRDSVSAPPANLVHVHEEIAERVQNGIVPALGQPASSDSPIPMPRDQHAYWLYLRSVATSRDPGPNKLAIQGLERSVSLDPDYSPAWIELGWRYYIDAQYGDGGDAAYDRAAAANAKAMALDPNGVVNSVTLKAEQGDLEGAYDEATGFLKRRPDASNAHYELSYVYRYAGLLDKAALECDQSLAMDPGQYIFRSCSKVFMLLGNYQRASVFINLDGSSAWSTRERMFLALRQKGLSRALELAIPTAQDGDEGANLIVAHLQKKPARELRGLSRRLEASAQAKRDPEDKYEAAALLSFTGETNSALHLLRSAIEHNYCSYPALDSDPLLAGIRSTSEFAGLRDFAMKCQQDFFEARLKKDPSGIPPPR